MALPYCTSQQGDRLDPIMQVWSAMAHCLAGIKNGRQYLIINLDELQCLLSNFRRLSGHRCDSITYKAHSTIKGKPDATRATLLLSVRLRKAFQVFIGQYRV